MKYIESGFCPRCGAAIYAVSKDGDWIEGGTYSAAPTAHFTCSCRLTLPAATLEAAEDLPADSTAAADRRHVEGLRPTAPGDERVSDV